MDLRGRRRQGRTSDSARTSDDVAVAGDVDESEARARLAERSAVVAEATLRDAREALANAVALERRSDGIVDAIERSLEAMRADRTIARADVQARASEVATAAERSTAAHIEALRARQVADETANAAGVSTMGRALLDPDIDLTERSPGDIAEIAQPILHLDERKGFGSFLEDAIGGTTSTEQD